jgi:hypothetical protein
MRREKRPVHSQCCLHVLSSIAVLRQAPLFQRKQPAVLLAVCNAAASRQGKVCGRSAACVPSVERRCVSSAPTDATRLPDARKERAPGWPSPRQAKAPSQDRACAAPQPSVLSQLLRVDVGSQLVAAVAFAVARPQQRTSIDTLPHKLQRLVTGCVTRPMSTREGLQHLDRSCWASQTAATAVSRECEYVVAICDKTRIDWCSVHFNARITTLADIWRQCSACTRRRSKPQPHSRCNSNGNRRGAAGCSPHSSSCSSHGHQQPALQQQRWSPAACCQSALLQTQRRLTPPLPQNVQVCVGNTTLCWAARHCPCLHLLPRLSLMLTPPQPTHMLPHNTARRLPPKWRQRAAGWRHAVPGGPGAQQGGLGRQPVRPHLQRQGTHAGLWGGLRAKGEGLPGLA